MLLAVEICVVEQSVNVYLFMSVCVCVFSRVFDPAKHLVKTFCKNGIVNIVSCYMLFFHGRNCRNC